MTSQSRLRRFISELKRRHVFRVATVYAVAAWGAIQFATTVFPVLGVGQWAVTAVVIAAIVGAPITLVVAWALDLTAEGVEVTDQPGKRVRMPWLRGTVATFIVVVALAGGYALYLRVKPAEAARTPSVAVFPFTVEGGSSIDYLREGIVNLLSTTFNGVGTMRSVDPTTLLNSLSSRERTSVDRETAERVARKVGATSYVIGSIAQTTDTLITIEATLFTLDSKELPAKSVVTGSEGTILDKVDELVRLLLTGQMQDAANHLTRTAALTTDKLSALKSYLLGEAEYRQARWLSAMNYFKRAAADDSTFALANYRLAVAADWASSFDTARVALDRALRHSQRLSLRDRQLLMAFNASLHGRADEAENAYRVITRDHPDDVEAWYRYGEVLYHYNPPRGRSVFESEPMFERAVQAAPDVEPMMLHLMELALYRKDYKHFDELTKRIDAGKPAVMRRITIRNYEAADARKRQEIEDSIVRMKAGDILFIATGLAQFAHDLPGAERVAALLTNDADPYKRGTAYLALAQYAVARNDWATGRQYLNKLAEVSPDYAIEHEALWLSVPFANTPAESLKAMRARLIAWQPSSRDSVREPNVYLAAHNGVHGLLREYLIGVLSARLRDDAAVEESARRLEQVQDSAKRDFAQHLAMAVRAHGAFARGDYAEALARLKQVHVDADLDLVYNSVFWNGAYERYLRAESLRALGRMKEAEPWYQSLQEGRNEVVFYAPAQRALAAAKTAA